MKTNSLFSIVHQRDSFAALRALEPWSYDCVITDPPYSQHCQDNQMSGSTLAKVDLPFQALSSYLFARDLVRVAKRWALSFCTVEDFGHYEQIVGGPRKLGGAYIRSGIWVKPNSMGQLSGNRPAASYEGIAIMHRKNGRLRWNGRGSFALWVCNGTRGEIGRHKNQKPLELCLILVSLFSEPEELIFDPYCGSGRIGEACMLLGRRYVGWDQSAKWCKRSEARLLRASAMYGSLIGKLPKNLCYL